MSSTTPFVRHMGQLDDKIDGRNRGLSKQCSMNSMFQEHTCCQVIQKAVPKVAKTTKGLLYQNKSMCREDSLSGTIQQLTSTIKGSDDFHLPTEPTLWSLTWLQQFPVPDSDRTISKGVQNFLLQV